MKTNFLVTVDHDAKFYLGNGCAPGLNAWYGLNDAIEAQNYASANNWEDVLSFASRVERLFKNKEIEQLEFSISKSAEFFVFEFLYCKAWIKKKSRNNPVPYQYVDKLLVLLEDPEKFLKHNQLMLCCFNLLWGDSEYVLKEIGQDKRDCIKGKIEDVRFIVEDLISKSENVRKIIKSATDIQFWRAEYTKRKFALDLRNDPVVREKARLAYEFVKYASPIESTDFSIKCSRCMFDDNSLDFYDVPFIKVTDGCPLVMCKKIVGVLQRVEGWGIKDISMMYYSQVMKNIPLNLYSRGLSEITELSEQYGLYPSELFSIASPGCLIEHDKRYKHLPKPRFYSPAYCNIKDYFNNANFAYNNYGVRNDFKEILDAEKEINSLGKYYDNNECRIVGLWLWDNLKLAEKGSSFNELLLKLITEDWFNQLSLSRVDKLTLSKIESKSLKSRDIEDIQSVVDKYRRYYKLAEKCIEEGKVMPLNSVARGKKIKA